MTGQGIARSSSTRSSLIALGYPLGLYMARVYTADRVGAASFGWLGAVERGFYRARAHRPARASRTGRATAKTVLVFSVLFSVVLYAIQRLQGTCS